MHDAKNFTVRGPEGIINHLDGFYSNHIEGKTKTKNRENIIHKFKAFDRGILSLSIILYKLSNDSDYTTRYEPPIRPLKCL